MISPKTRGMIIGLAATVVLVGTVVAVLGLVVGGSDGPTSDRSKVEVLPFVPTTHTRTDTLTKADLIAPDGKIVGMFSPNTPYNTAEYDSYVAAAGTVPNALNIFTKWDSPFRADGADRAYSRGAIPVVSWESWATGAVADDPRYTLASIAAGEHDEYVRTFAKDVAAYGKPVIIRFDHEMNGSWYPWGVGVNGNTPEQYQAAWRHVHEIFGAEGADNAAWVWSVNIIRAVPHTVMLMGALYPGDAYVDYVGITGYSISEATASDLFGPTTNVIRTFTQKPILLSEVGARPHDGKSAFITSLFAYVAEHADVAGVIWFETTKADGATGDYTFNDTPENSAAYAAGAAAVPKLTITHDVEERVRYGDDPTTTKFTIKDSLR